MTLLLLLLLLLLLSITTTASSKKVQGIYMLAICFACLKLQKVNPSV